MTSVAETASKFERGLRTFIAQRRARELPTPALLFCACTHGPQEVESLPRLRECWTVLRLAVSVMANRKLIIVSH